MNWIDIMAIVLCVAFIIRGVIKGFINQLFSFAALLLGLLSATYMNGIVLNLMVDKASMEGDWTGPVSRILTFIVVYIVVCLLGKLLTKFFHAVSLGGLNRFLGALVGAVKAILVMLIVCICIITFESGLDKDHCETLHQSHTYQILQNFTNMEELIDVQKKKLDSKRMERNGQAKGKADRTWTIKSY